MNLLETCPNKVISGTGEPTCFDMGLGECIWLHPNTIRDFCRKDFRQCPYYHTDGARARFDGERGYRRIKAKRLEV